MQNLVFPLVVIIAFLFSITSIKAQTTGERNSSYITEFGIGYPISLTSQTEYFATYFNLGYIKQFNDGLSIGTFAFSALDIGDKGDYSGGIGLRLGKKIMNHSPTIDLGYTLISKEYGKLSGPLVGLNVPLTDKLAIHLRYKQLGSATIPDRKVAELGINVGEFYFKRAVLPALGIVAIGGAIIIDAISNSR